MDNFYIEVSILLQENSAFQYLYDGKSWRRETNRSFVASNPMRLLHDAVSSEVGGFPYPFILLQEIFVFAQARNVQRQSSHHHHSIVSTCSNDAGLFLLGVCIMRDVALILHISCNKHVLLELDG